MFNKLKKIASFILILTIISPLLAKNTFAVSEDSGMKVEAKSALLMEPISGKIIYEKNANEKFAPASVTKIMTMLLAMEAIDSGKISLADKITCSENAKKMGGSTMLLDTGEIRSVSDILKGIAIASGNDAAIAMGEYLAGSEEAFVKAMNQKAKDLGMKNTTFKNCTGLPAEGHLSTAYDIALMSRELLKHKDILKFTGTYMETISEGRKTPIELVNHNKLVRFFKGCDGLKTGYTQEAKYCISATATRDGVRMLSVIMGAPTFKIRNRDAGILLNHGFSMFEGKKLLKKDQELGEIKSINKKNKAFIAKVKEDLNVVMEKGQSGDLTNKIILDETKNEFLAGEVVGKCEVYCGEVLVGQVEIYTDRDIEKPNIFDKLKFKIMNSFNG